MADKNKKTKPLAADQHVHPDRQVEIIPTLTHPVSGPHAVSRSADVAPNQTESLSDFTQRMRARIESLEFRLSQGETRRKALEKELEVREEITDTINRDVREARNQLTKANAEIETLREYCDALDAQQVESAVAAEKDKRIADLRKQLATAGSELSDLRNYIDGRKDKWEKVDDDFLKKQSEIEELQDEIEKLTSELADSREFRRALESHVSEIERRNDEAVRRMKTRLKRALRKMSAYERKLEVKEDTITDLLAELDKQNGTRELADDIETILKKIDGEKPAGATGAATRDRITRQLIGTAEDKELRFPLFRNRLTIGRTTHNDIQLDMRFVSRRHAVIATDNNVTRIIDWGSRNGVFVNQKRVTERILESGDVITIGRTSLRYEERRKR